MNLEEFHLEKNCSRTKDGNRIFKPFNKEQNVIELIKLLRDKYFLRKKKIRDFIK